MVNGKKRARAREVGETTYICILRTLYHYDEVAPIRSNAMSERNENEKVDLRTQPMSLSAHY